MTEVPIPRPNQAKIIEYTTGRMGVSAVPGSGKTWTLSRLAAKLVSEGGLKRHQQVLVVTLVNSARGKFEQQVREFLGEQSLGTRYRVRTLHGLANDIVSERPALVGLSDDFQIMPEALCRELAEESLTSWFDANRATPLFDYLTEKEKSSNKSRNDLKQRLVDVALNFISMAKDRQKTPQELRTRMDLLSGHAALADMCLSIYEAYERGLRYRGAVDFDDLIRLALEALNSDREFLDRLRYRWPIILEDEAQDSSRLQEQILRCLAGDQGNWVRVGDPNQAIYETFTTASPKSLIDFLSEPGVLRRELPDSGRSAPLIINLANYLIDWTISHPNIHIRTKQALSLPHILPLSDGNPEDTPLSIELRTDLVSADDERKYVCTSVKSWLEHNRNRTVAILVPRNQTGADFVKVLRAMGVEYEEALKNTTSTRQVAGSLYRIVRWLSRPGDDEALSDAFAATTRGERDDEIVKLLVKRLRGLSYVERFMAPRDRDWLIETFGVAGGGRERERLEEFRALARRWQAGVVLPIDELLLTIAGDVFTDPAELATAYSIAISVRSRIDARRGAALNEIVDELKLVAKNISRVTGLSEADSSFDPESYKGRVVVTTLHKAKGLEWDRVYLTSVNNYDFPSADEGDRYQGELYYVRDKLNLQAEALGMLDTLATGRDYVEGGATFDARIEYASERLRLLFVGITRARRELIVTTNNGKGNARPAKALLELKRMESNRTEFKSTESIASC